MIVVSRGTFDTNYFRSIFVGYFFELEGTFLVVYFYTYRGFEIWTNAGGNDCRWRAPWTSNHAMLLSKLISEAANSLNCVIGSKYRDGKKCNYSLYYLNWILRHEQVTSVIQSARQRVAAAAAESALLIAIPGRGGGTVRHAEATFAVFTLQPRLTLVSLQMPWPSNKLQSLTVFWRATANLLTKMAFFSTSILSIPELNLHPQAVCLPVSPKRELHLLA